MAEIDDNGNFKDEWEKVVWSNWKDLILYLPNNYKQKIIK